MNGYNKPVALTTGFQGKEDKRCSSIVQNKHNQIDVVLQRLQNVRESGSGFMACCPAHDDRTPSLSVTLAEDRILLHCFAGCDNDAILSAIGCTFSDLFLTDRPTTYEPRTRPHRAQTQPVRVQAGPKPKEIRREHEYESASFLYHDSAGNVVATKRRFDYVAVYEDGATGRGKRFTVNPSGLRLPLYELPAVESAIRQGFPVYLLEGEKKADLLNDYFRYEWGINAVATSYGGHWRKDLADTLSGSRCVIIPDRDDAGKRKAERVIRDLYGIASSVAVCQLSDLLTALEGGEGIA